MGMPRAWTIGLAMGSSLLAAPEAAGAQGWTETVSGEVGYGITFTTAASLLCGSGRYGLIDRTSCIQAPGSITFVNDGATLTITIAGVSGQTIVTPTGHEIVLATITTTVGGEGAFTFPEVHNVTSPIVNAAVRVDITAPNLATESASRRYRRYADDHLDGHCCRYDITPTIAGAERRGWEGILWQYSFPGITPENRTQYVTARVTLAPEPGTIALVAGGLLALGGVGLRARRRDASAGDA